MSKKIDFLYETSVLKQIEEKVTETRDENGQKIEIVRTVKKAKPIKIAILHPRRKLYEGADIFYAKQIADYIKAGLLPYSLVAKRYANDGGALSEPEKEKLKKLKEEVAELEIEFFALGSDADTKVRNTLLSKINDINGEIVKIQNAYADIFDNTAEVKARNKTIEWWALHLCYIDEDDTGYKPIFGDGTYDERLEQYDEVTDRQQPHIDEAIRKLSYLISFWFAAKAVLSKIDFETMDKLYNDTVTDYTVIDESEKPAETLARVAEISVEEATKGIEAAQEAFRQEAAKPTEAQT
jgi:hypothetical protein